MMSFYMKIKRVFLLFRGIAIPATITFLVYLTLFPATVLRKRQIRQTLLPSQQSLNQNTQNKNETLVAGPILFLVLIVLSILILPFFLEFIGDFRFPTLMRIVNVHMFHIIPSVLLPTAFFISKPYALKGLLEHLN